MDSRPTIAVVGAGFSGTVTAAHLLLRGLLGGLRVVLVERSGRWGCGVAYGTRAAAHLLNVPAGQMSAFPHEPDDFLRFARGRDPSVGPGAFLPRMLYGEYLEELLGRAERAAPAGTTLYRVAGEAADVEAEPGGRHAAVVLDTGARFTAERVVLAHGNAAPAHPSAADAGFRASPRYVSDPWAPGALDGIRRDGEVLLLGTGLTMVDVVAELRARGHRAPLTALSRRGLLPHPHRAAGPAAPVSSAALEDGPPTARAYVRALRAHVSGLAARGGDWRDAISALRPRLPALWQSLPARERARFLRHLRPYWETHRHRVSPGPLAAVEEMIASGDLRLRAGRLLRLTAHADGVEALVRPRGSGAAETVRAAHLVSCIGPETDVRRTGAPLEDALLGRGLARPDPLGLGWDTAPDLALRGADGEPSDRLFYVGPLLRAAYWESTAVPELRVHAARLAAGLATSLDGAVPPPAEAGAGVPV